MPVEDTRLRSIIENLKGLGVALSDIEKEVTLRNKWGKRQNSDMADLTTEELTEAVEKWLRF